MAGMQKNEMVGPSDILERSGKRKGRRNFNTPNLELLVLSIVVLCVCVCVVYVCGVCV